MRATSSIALSHLFKEIELKDNLLPVNQVQKKTIFCINKYVISKFKLPEFTKNSIITFSICVDMNFIIYLSSYNIVLDLDPITEFRIKIDTLY